jgi:hypothetical protein
VLEAQIKRRPTIKKGSTAARQRVGNISQQKLTIRLDLGDRHSWYCVLDEAGQILRGCNARNMNPEKAEALSPELQRALEPSRKELGV